MGRESSDVMTTLTPPKPEQSMADLKETIACGEYAVDPGVLADAVLWKMDLVKRMRRALEPEHQRDRRRPRGRAAGRSRLR
jgi:hypothetical protein